MEEEEPAAVSERKKRDTETVEKSQDLIMPPHPYNFHPFLGLGAVKPEDSDNKLYKYIPYYGFVPAEKEDKEATAEEMKDQQYKFVPFYGFVPVNADGEIEETAKDYGNLKYTFHPYYGFLPTPTDGEDKTQLYKLDPVVGFYPSEKTEEVEEEVAELEAKRRKREAQFLGHPVFIQHHYLPLYPQLPSTAVTGEDGVSPQEVNTPGRVATEEETDEKTEEERPAAVPIAPLQLVNWRIPIAYPGTVPVAYPGTVPVTQVLPATQVIYPVQGQTMLPEDKFPVIPHAEDNNKPGPVIL